MEKNSFPPITSQVIQSYCDQHSSPPSAMLQQLENISAAAGDIKMISGAFLGQFLSMIALVMRPTNILEIGTFTGYGTLSLLRGLPQDGRIYTIEKNEDIRSYYSQVADEFTEAKIIQLMGDAATIIPEIDATFDLVFVDAAKRQYISYYELVMPKLRQGGVILADNVLWKGKIVTDENDKLGEGLDAFNKHVMNDDRVENIILPIDDGIHFIYKK